MRLRVSSQAIAAAESTAASSLVWTRPARCWAMEAIAAEASVSSAARRCPFALSRRSAPCLGAFAKGLCDPAQKAAHVPGVTLARGVDAGHRGLSQHGKREGAAAQRGALEVAQAKVGLAPPAQVPPRGGGALARIPRVQVAHRGHLQDRRRGTEPERHVQVLTGGIAGEALVEWVAAQQVRPEEA